MQQHSGWIRVSQSDKMCYENIQYYQENVKNKCIMWLLLTYCTLQDYM